MGVCGCSMFCCTILCVHSSIAIILMGKRELVALLNMSSWCLVVVERLFHALQPGCLQFVIVVFPDDTHLLFLLLVLLSMLRPLVTLLACTILRRFFICGSSFDIYVSGWSLLCCLVCSLQPCCTCYEMTGLLAVLCLVFSCHLSPLYGVWVRRGTRLY